MKAELKAGLRHTLSLRIDESLTVPQVSSAFAGFEEMPPVFATAFMVGFIEWACIEALRPFLDLNERTVGTHVDVSHVAATPVGMTATAEIELIAVEGRKLRFKVRCSDEAGLIGEGFHERAVIDRGKFMQRLSEKAARASISVS
ncbi:thioesterase family protein [Mesorhizobium sp. BAC0120]|uniref:thioesterase family protein n=1 Tax=Mesorhizobium sp. BAC0120 TaxID=3090670 RepID=UPI00298C4369|nr:thioesterase family protein [Mesorhizobium sp. BAC0120]MDW6025116.1 thioesterase family protein [Mesorhizobium sp. BAC0120]